MAQITVIYKDFKEMKAVAREILADELQGAAEQKRQAEEGISVAEPELLTPSVSSGKVETAQIPTAPVAPTPQPAPVQGMVPTANPAYSLDDLARAAMTLMESGRQSDLQGLLKQFGVDALPLLPKEQYGAFATALRGMGAKI